jgi:hypothetical protein
MRVGEPLLDVPVRAIPFREWLGLTKEACGILAGARNVSKEAI